MMKLIVLKLIGCIGLGIYSISYAEIYRCPDALGSVTLANIPIDKNCVAMKLPSSSNTNKTNTNENNSGSNNSTPTKYKQSYETASLERKKIIQHEISLETDRLNQVQQEIKSLLSKSSNTPSSQNRIDQLRTQEEVHTNNLATLKKELLK